MYKAVTLIELLITLVVMVISIYFLSPIIFQLSAPIVLNNEIDQIKSFIYHIQTQARYQKRSYSITIRQNSANHQWCMIAIEKKSSKETACDCLNLKSCRLTSAYSLYHTYLNQIKLKSNRLYPNVFMNIDGVAGRLETTCLGLAYRNVQQIVQFETNGLINIAQPHKRTQCRE